MTSNLSRAYALAPQDLANYRLQRYSGETVCSKMADFVASDRETIERVYRFLVSLFAKLSPPPERDPAGPLKEILREFQFYQLLDEMRGFGSASYAARPEQTLAKTIHDIRGGALISLVGHLDALVDLADEAEVPLPLFSLVRDHMKILRNSLSDLDYARRQQDLLPRAHSIQVMVDKWRNPAFGEAARRVEIQVTNAYPVGTISECCVESAALDRILYNLMNNAARHAASPVVELCVVAIPEGADPKSLRFVVKNEIFDADREHLLSVSLDGINLDGLFTAGVSTTGSGLGLSISAEFVANAYGLLQAEEAVNARYVGARLDGSQFSAWFHWPLSTWRSEPEAELELEKTDLV